MLTTLKARWYAFSENERGQLAALAFIALAMCGVAVLSAYLRWQKEIDQALGRIVK